METIPLEIFQIIGKLTDISTVGRLGRVNKLFNQYIEQDDIWEILTTNFYRTIDNRSIISLDTFYYAFFSWRKVARNLCYNTNKFKFNYHNQTIIVNYFIDRNYNEIDKFVDYLRLLLGIFKLKKKRSIISSYILVLEDEGGEIAGDVLFRVSGDAVVNYLHDYAHIFYYNAVDYIKNVYMNEISESDVDRVIHKAGYTHFVDTPREYLTDRELENVSRDQTKYRNFLSTLI